MHRIGRTTRAGRSGKSITFVFGRDIHRLEAIERYTKQPVKRMKIPSQEEVEGAKADTVVSKVRDLLESGRYNNYDMAFDRLLSAGNNPSEIISALFHILNNQNNREFETITEDSETFTPGKKKFSKESDSRKGSRKRSRKRPFKSKRRSKDKKRGKRTS